MSEKEDKPIEVIITEVDDVAPSAPVDFFDVDGVIDTVSAVPTNVPKKLAEQVLIYANGATYRLYVYDTVNNAWKYTALT